LIYGRRAKLFCSPGDSLFIEIDATIFNDLSNTKPNNQFFVRVIGGNRVKDNADLIAFMLSEPNTLYNGKFMSTAITSKSANDFKTFNIDRENEYRRFSISFKKQNQTSELINQWMDDYIKFQTWNDLFGYPFEHAYNNKISEASVVLPADYYDFLNNFPMNDNQVISTKHAYVLQNYSRFIIDNRKDTADNFCKIMKGMGIVPASKVEIQRICRETSGFTQNIVLTNFYLRLLKAQLLKEFEAIYDSSTISNSFFRSVINNEHLSLQKFIDKQVADGLNLKTISSNDVNNLIGTIRAKYSGKVIYIDFWAPWCAPCMAELSHSKELQEIYKNKDVVFLFLGNNCKEDSWKATIVNKKMTGEQMLLDDSQYEFLAEKFGITGIPHYVLIDKKGNLISKNATRPSEKELITKQINQLLN